MRGVWVEVFDEVKEVFDDGEGGCLLAMTRMWGC